MVTDRKTEKDKERDGNTCGKQTCLPDYVVDALGRDGKDIISCVFVSYCIVVV